MVIDYTFYNTNFLTTNLSAINFFILVQKNWIKVEDDALWTILKVYVPQQNTTQVWSTYTLPNHTFTNKFLIYIYELQSHRLGKKNYKFVDTPTFTHMVVFEPLKVPIWILDYKVVKMTLCFLRNKSYKNVQTLFVHVQFKFLQVFMFRYGV